MGITEEANTTRLEIAIPVLRTERLTLRAHRLDDFEACAAMWADPEVTRFIGGRPLSREETWARLLRYAGHWVLLNFGYWVVEDRATRTFIGEIGFTEAQREMEPSIVGVPELGWVFSSHVHGKGYATEATSAALEWGRANLESKKIVCIINPENTASIRVADNIGFHNPTPAIYRGATILLFERDLS